MCKEFMHSIYVKLSTILKANGISVRKLLQDHIAYYSAHINWPACMNFTP